MKKSLVQKLTDELSVKEEGEFGLYVYKVKTILCILDSTLALRFKI